MDDLHCPEVLTLGSVPTTLGIVGTWSVLSVRFCWFLPKERNLPATLVGFLQPLLHTGHMFDLNFLPSLHLKLSEHCLAGAVHKSVTSSVKNGLRSRRALGLDPGCAIHWVPLRKACSLSEFGFTIDKDGTSNAYTWDCYGRNKWDNVHGYTSHSINTSLITFTNLVGQSTIYHSL